MSLELISKRKIDNVNKTPSPERRNRQKFEETLSSIDELDVTDREITPDFLSSTASTTTIDYDTVPTSSTDINDISTIFMAEDRFRKELVATSSPRSVIMENSGQDTLSETIIYRHNNIDSMEVNQETLNADVVPNPVPTHDDLHPDIVRVFRSDAFNFKLNDVVTASMASNLIPIKTSINALQTSIASVGTAITPLAAKLDTLTALSNRLEEDHKVLEETAASTKAVTEMCNSHDTKIDSLQQQLDDMNQSRRINNLIFSGVFESTGEIIAVKICEIAAGINIRLNTWDIQDSFRIGNAEEDRPRLVLVRFVNYKARMDLYTNRMRLKDPMDRKVFASEDLTEKNSKIFFEARTLARAKMFQAWTLNGRVFLRTQLNGEGHSIPKLEDIVKFRAFPQGNIPKRNNRTIRNN